LEEVIFKFISGVIKHHVLNANLMRNGSDFSVFINTGQEFDGSDTGAR
jgi:deoxyhypusine synthase